MCDDYYLNVLQDKNNFKLIRKLTDEEYERFNKASIFMQKLNTKLYFFRMVDYDYIELKNFEKSYNDNINYYLISVNINEVIFSFFKLLNNYLSSVILFLNQYGANVKRDYEKDLVDEFNELHIEGMPKVESLNALVGNFVNLEYRLPNGNLVKFLDDSKTYLGNQLESEFGGDRCFGVIANMEFLLVCTYEENGSNPELVIYKKR